MAPILGSRPHRHSNRIWLGKRPENLFALQLNIDRRLRRKDIIEQEFTDNLRLRLNDSSFYWAEVMQKVFGKNADELANKKKRHFVDTCRRLDSIRNELLL